MLAIRQASEWVEEWSRGGDGVLEGWSGGNKGVAAAVKRWVTRPKRIMQGTASVVSGN